MSVAVILGLATARGEESAAVIRTQRASFHVMPFHDVPGWAHDDVLAAWGPLLRSCQRLAKRETWSALCTEARTVPVNTPAVRRFFEERFVPLQIRAPDGAFQGGLTAYYEPSIRDAPQPGDGFTIPVYGVPRDLLMLDGALLASAQGDGTLTLRRNGHELVADATPGAARYRFDTTVLNALAEGSLDRRLRVRLDGDRLEPYFTREEILSRTSLDAPVLAWIADPLQLYAIQVQGAGRIVFADGTGLRIGFAEQNGHPFKPVRLTAQRSAPSGVRVRGGGNDELNEQFDFADDRPEAGTEGARHKKTRGTPDGNSDNPDAPREDADQRALRIARLKSDPSFVFFREVSGGPEEGPPGALGVSLTPERSVAVDPRVTPLGYPMFVSALDTKADDRSPRRIVLAQDTGGAIRGPLHADLFVGTGHEAGMRAWGTGLRAGLWLLVPRAELPKLLATLQSPTAKPAERLRGQARVLAECVVDDPMYCRDGILEGEAP